jgi:aminopeptidase-like protein
MSVEKYFNIAKYSLFPICRSITGAGLKKTLKIIQSEFPKLKIHGIRSGTKVFDWRVPSEWNVNDAYVLDKNNKKIINFKENNLHIISYSSPVSKFLSKKKLLDNLYSLPNKPDAIPYITSYYKKRWGFCVTHKKKKEISKNYNLEDKFKVIINSSFNPKGYLNYGELILKGKSKEEVLISTYICHPSMANNELSGPIVAMSLINYFSKIKNLEKTLRFVFIPETIGSIVYINKNLNKLKKNIIGGFNLSCIGDERAYSCMLSKYQNSPSDNSIIEAYKKLKLKYKVYSFLKRGSDERQYNSPGIDLKISSIFRSKYGEYPEYHTSLDNFNLVTLKGIKGGLKVSKTAIQILLKKIIPKNKILCEPNMGKRGLYPTLSTRIKKPTEDLMNFLTYADGKNDLEIVSKYINKNYTETKKIYKLLKKKKLVE